MNGGVAPAGVLGSEVETPTCTGLVRCSGRGNHEWALAASTACSPRRDRLGTSTAPALVCLTVDGAPAGVDPRSPLCQSPTAVGSSVGCQGDRLERVDGPDTIRRWEVVEVLDEGFGIQPDGG